METLVLHTQVGDPRHVQSEQVSIWFEERGYNVTRFAKQDLIDGHYDCYLQDKENIIVYGGVQVVKAALKRLDIPEPPNLDFPIELVNFLGRNVRIGTLGEIRKIEGQHPKLLPLHIKPAYKHKLFPGMLISKFADLIPTSWLKDDEPVIIQEPVEFVSEWRATILRNKIINVANYKGDPCDFPNRQVMESGLEAFVNKPIGCSMDWGITSEGHTILVEVNDGYALGNYGVKGWQYTALVECRWRELLGLNDNGVGIGIEKVHV